MNQRYTCSLIQEFKSTNIVTNSELGRRREDGGVRNIHKEQRYETPRFRTLRLKLNTTKSQIFKFTKECYVGVCRLQVKSSDCVALSSLQTWYKLSAVELWKLLRVWKRKKKNKELRNLNEHYSTKGNVSQQTLNLWYWNYVSVVKRKNSFKFHV